MDDAIRTQARNAVTFVAGFTLAYLAITLCFDLAYTIEAVRDELRKRRTVLIFVEVVPPASPEAETPSA